MGTADPYPANLRPVRQRAPCPPVSGNSLATGGERPGDIDITIVRENTEGEYSAIGGRFHEGMDDEVVFQQAVFTRRGVDRILTYAYDLARSRPKKHLTSATKSNGITITMPFWDERVALMAARYPDVRTDRYHIDILTAHFVQHPDWFDVVVGSNLFGDILSDLGPGIAGTIGIAPSANLNPERRFPSMFEPVHGSAPDIAGKGIANPIGQIWAGAMMLDHLGYPDAAADVLAASKLSSLADLELQIWAVARTRKTWGALSRSKSVGLVRHAAMAREPVQTYNEGRQAGRRYSVDRGVPGVEGRATMAVLDGMDLPNSTPRLAGRQTECAALWAQFSLGCPGTVPGSFVTGEPGIGKTRLLHEVCSRAAGDGATVLRGGSAEAEGMPPYLPFLEALGSYISTTETELLRVQAGPHAGTLSTVFPELSRCLEDAPAPYVLPPDQARLRLYQGVGALLSAIAAPSGLVLVLDDLQWADAASLDLLCHVCAHQQTSRLLIVGAYRDGEMAAHPPLERAIATLVHHRLVTIIGLQPLPGDDIARLAESYLGGPTDEETCRLLHLHGEGNPFFSEELLRGWIETGALTRRHQRWVRVS